jgi:hypothetical protein
MMLTETLRGQQCWTEALEAARRTQELDGYRADGLYLEATAQSRLGRPDDAFAALHAAIANGFTEYWRLRVDTDFDAIRDDPRFAQLPAG